VSLNVENNLPRRIVKVLSETIILDDSQDECPADIKSPTDVPVEEPLASLSPIKVPLESLSPIKLPLESLSPIKLPLASLSPIKLPLESLSPIKLLKVESIQLRKRSIDSLDSDVTEPYDISHHDIGSPTASPAKDVSLQDIKSPFASPVKDVSRYDIESPTVSPVKDVSHYDIESPTLSPAKDASHHIIESPTASPVKDASHQEKSEFYGGVTLPCVVTHMQETNSCLHEAASLAASLAPEVEGGF
jgi:hypothetical protein